MIFYNKLTFCWSLVFMPV